MRRRSVINDNDLTKVNNKINDNDYKKSMNSSRGKRGKSWYKNRVESTERLADDLVVAYNAPNSRNFFMKCAWHMSEYEIMEVVKASRRPNIISPLKYFIRSCHNELIKKQQA